MGWWLEPPKTTYDLCLFKKNKQTKKKTSLPSFDANVGMQSQDQNL